MKKNVFTAFAVSLSVMAFAQSGVGVNTPNPTEMLDVNGTERIRVLPQSGTSNVIYTKPDGTKSTSKDQTFTGTKSLVADSNGVIGMVNWLPSESPIAVGGADGADAVATSQTISSRSGTTTTTSALATKSFTLTKKSLVTFSFNVSVSTILTYGGALLKDGTSKRFGAKLLLNSTTTIINSGIPFTNSGNDYASGFYYLNGSRALLLNAGTYSVDLIGSVYAFDADATGIRATFGATADDQLDIIAVPL